MFIIEQSSVGYVGYLIARFEYFQGPFAQEVDQDRNRRALSDGLFTFLLRPYYHTENPKILQKTGKKPIKPLPIRIKSGPEWTNYKFR